MRFRFDIPPALASNNPRHHAQGPARRRYQATLNEMALVVQDKCNRMQWKAIDGPVVALLDVHVADRRGVDVDACVKSSLDSLQRSGLLMNDRQVELLIARRIVGDGPPRIELGCVGSSELRWLARMVDVAWEDV